MAHIVKDPIYGYIRIEDNDVWRVIDSSAFQRLRHISQTSYAPLFPSAVHNRFVHSLGVYRLGHFVAKVIEKDCLPRGSEAAARAFLKVFELACLLHDIGHAPFSHTGEVYYDLESEREMPESDRKGSALNVELARFLDVEAIKQKAAAQHEIMSALTAVREFDGLIGSIEKQRFLARAITGYTYLRNPGREVNEVEGVPVDFLDCLISLLNGQVIDVDRMDYLIRDAYLTGFNTIVIDYKRLLSSIRISDKTESGQYEVVYQHHAVGVLENCVYAHDAERKWIQCHPTVIYEGYLLSKAIERVLHAFFPTRHISAECLTDEGIELKKSGESTGLKLKNLTDGDVLFLMKNIDSNEISEYFSRESWRSKLWKSEAEFHNYFSAARLGKEPVRKALQAIGEMIQSLHKQYDDQLNEQVLEKFEAEYLQGIAESEGRSAHFVDIYRKANNKKLGIMKQFKSFAAANNIPFDFLFLGKTAFKSGFSKEDLSKLKIRFDDSETLAEFKDVTNMLMSREEGLSSQLFYVFCPRFNSVARPSKDAVREFVDSLVREAGN